MSGIKTMKKIPITEENFEVILWRMKKICSKYKMLRSERYLSEDGHVVYKHNPIAFSSSYKIFSPHCECEYVGVTKHIFREEYEKGHTTSKAYSSYLFNLNSGIIPLIHLSLNDDTQFELVSEVRIRFLPFGLGFVIYPDIELEACRCTYNCTAKILFMANILSGRIKNLYAEKAIRDSKLEEYFKHWKASDKSYYYGDLEDEKEEKI